MWETALLYRQSGAAAGAPAPGVGNSPTFRPAWHRSGRAGTRCGKQPYIPVRLAPQRACWHPMWETALHSGPPGTAAGVLAPDVGISPTFRSAWHRSGRAGARCGKQPYFAGRRAQQRARRRQMWETALLCGPPGTAAGAPVPGVGNSPTSGRAGTSAEPPAQDMGNSPTSGRAERQLSRRRRIWETALLPGVRNGS